MAVVIDEIDASVSGEERGTGGSPGGSAAGAPKPFARDELAAELHRVARHKERLRAD
jgi:hypothetical protein